MKKILLFSILLLLSVSLFAVEYAIGDVGPAGGLIFYDCDADNDSGNPDGFVSSECGWRYLEAAPNDLPKKYTWGPEWHFYFSEFLGYGKENTESFMERVSVKNNTAAKACADYEVNGFDDWFLPSIEELKMMYDNLKANGIGTFTSSGYWSSSEDGGDTTLAMGWKFGNNSFMDEDRSLKFSVRPVRSF